MSQERVKFKGRDVMEAVSAARRHFGVPRHDLGYQVTHQPAVGEVADPAGDLVEIEAWVEPGARPRPETIEYNDRRDDRHGRDHRRDRNDRHGRGERHGGGRHGERSRDRDRGVRNRERREESHFEQPEMLPGPDVTDASEILTKLVNGLVIGLDLRLYVEEIIENDIGLRVRLSGADVSLLLENDAEGLESFQYLANRVLHRDGRIPGRVSFDAGDFRAKQEEQLLETARRKAEEVIETGQVVKLAPMGPYERRLVHLALAETEGVRTFSTGGGYRRRLHIAPAKKAADEAATDEPKPEESGEESAS